MALPKLEFQEFNGDNDFNLWKIKMRALWVYPSFEFVLNSKGKRPSKMTDEELEDCKDKAHSIIVLSLGYEVLRQISQELKETSAAALWQKLENL